MLIFAADIDLTIFSFFILEYPLFALYTTKNRENFNLPVQSHKFLILNVTVLEIAAYIAFLNTPFYILIID